MATTKAEVLTLIEKMEEELKHTADNLKGQRGFVVDALKITLPMQRDQLMILRAMVEMEE